MFDQLTSRLSNTFEAIKGKGRLSEKNIRNALKEVRTALIEADVALPVVKKFIERVRVKAIGTTVLKSLTPGQAFIKVVREELTEVLGKTNETLDLKAAPPVVILMAGLQGAGKTTTVAKLAKFLKERQKKRILLASVDTYRPAAVEQLATLAKEIDIEAFPTDVTQKPTDIAKEALTLAKKKSTEVLIVDTAGRLHVDDEMMSEIKALHSLLSPTETLFVVDSMTGQDAANTAKAFDEALPLTGVILTKVDGDARGGAALSIRMITGKPIKFMGTGEKTESLEPFHPERIVSRLLGMGDILSLIEEAEHKVDKESAEKLAKKLKKGKKFDLEDFKEQLTQMNKMGGVGNLMSKMPMGMGGKIPDNLDSVINEKLTKQMTAIINSMTPKERRFPDLINGSRRRRIAQGSGTEVQDVNKLLKQHQMMAKMMKKFSKGGMRQMRQLMSQLGGNMPGGGSRPF